MPSISSGRASEFFGLACEQDLEGIVAKGRHGAYGEKWFKIRNRATDRASSARSDSVGLASDLRALAEAGLYESASRRSAIKSSELSSPIEARRRFCGVLVSRPSIEARCSIKL
jgi:ATP-dependent DNA ligase